MGKLFDRINRKLKQIDEQYPIVQEIEWEPQPGPQSAAFHSTADEMLYGGEPGGGKTDLLVGLALQSHRRSLILRREATQLTSIVQRIEDLAGVNVGKVLEIGDRSIELAGCKTESHKAKYKGRPHDLKGFDEVTEFSQSQYEFIKTWNRTPISGQRCRVVATSNPPTDPSGYWIVSYWGPWLDPRHPRPAMSGELRYYIGNEEVDSPEPQQVGDRLITPRSRTFIRSGLVDNPILMATGYQSVLDNLPPELRSLQTADFAGSIPTHPYQVIPNDWVKQAQDRYKAGVEPQSIVACDPARGGADYTAIAARYGERIEVWDYPGSTTPDSNIVRDLVMQHLSKDVRVIVDVIGIGSAVVDTLRNHGVVVIPHSGSHGSYAKTKDGYFSFANKRAETWWRLRELLDPANGATLALPNHPKVMRDLTAPRWSLTLRGIILESKEAIKARLGFSPDVGDAIAMSCDLLSMQYSSSFGG